MQLGSAKAAMVYFRYWALADIRLCTAHVPDLGVSLRCPFARSGQERVDHPMVGR